MVDFWKKNRNLFAGISALLIAYVTVITIEVINHAIYPPPEKIDINNPESVKAYIDQAPVGVMIFVLAAYCIASFVGGYSVERLSSKNVKWPLIFFIAVFLFTVLAQFYQIPHPTWLVISSTLGVIFFGFLGARVADLRNKPLSDE